MNDDESFLDFDPPPADDHWQPRDDNEADWAVMKIKAAKAMVAAKEQERAKAIAKWDAYVEKETRQALRDTTFFEGKLHGYLLRLLESGTLGRKKSWNLPNGTLQLRTLPATYEVVNEEVFHAWCEAHDLIEVIVKPKLGQAKKRFAVDARADKIIIDTQTGEYIPGVEVTRQRREHFSVKLAGEPSTEEEAGE
jgi:hypothetical protein